METKMMMSCVSITSSIPRGTRSVGSSSSLCFGTKLLNSERVRLSVRVPVATGRRLTCNALFGLGVPELVVIAGVAALVFGPKKLPEVGRSIGKTVKSFQQAAKEFESELKKEPDSIATTGEDSSDKPVAPAQQDDQERDIQVSTSKDTL
ncbi:hypothetical protein VNO78_18475 [Psophocarpus tetragonolobus]|uniref:Sec-independent protein translocase protein TATA, chloroplastic n=1 Tax=Psophocarpus tetragonolobus TaxID=3891 RepID=A0AAN9SQ17_PSOTE